MDFITKHKRDVIVAAAIGSVTLLVQMWAVIVLLVAIIFKM